jgi:hypothetical protein
VITSSIKTPSKDRYEIRYEDSSGEEHVIFEYAKNIRRLVVDLEYEQGITPEAIIKIRNVTTKTN